MASAIRTKALGVFVSQQFIESVSEPASANLYLTVGKVEAWANDASPPIAEDSVEAKIQYWNSMIFAKKVTGNDLSLVVRRFNWSANTIYTPYSHTANNLFDSANSQFYVLTSDFNVYKCLNNNMSANSTIEPTSTNPSQSIQTSDGYVWKYLYSIDRGYRLRFMTDDWMPVRPLTLDDNSMQWDVQEAARDGAIESIFVTAQGTGYSNQSNVAIAITGDGTNATANVILDTTSNTVNSVVMTNPGSGYTYATATISGGGGTGATVTPIISPAGGHGSEPISELGASNIMINIRIKGTESDRITVGNDFRQIGILKDPILLGTGNISSNTVVSQTMKVFLTGAGAAYINDEWVYQGASLAAALFKGKVVTFNSTNNFLLLANTSGTISAATILGDDSSGSRFVSSVTDPELEKHSGTILYIDNIEAITRNTDQTEDIKIVLSF